MAIGVTQDRDFLRALHVRNFPVGFEANDAVDLLRYFGAVSVRTRVRFSRLEATAEFRNEAEALVTLLRLHQQRLDGRRLKAVFASPGDPNEVPEDQCQIARRVQKQNDLGGSRQDPILEKLDSNLYPPPSRTILLRIGNCIAKHPQLYFQVLRLLEELNLPSPFEAGHEVFEKGLFDVAEVRSGSEIHPEPVADDMQLSDGAESEEEESELEDEPAAAYQADTIPSHLKRRTAGLNTAERAKKVLKAIARGSQQPSEPRKRKKRKLEKPCFEEVRPAKKEILLPATLAVPAVNPTGEVGSSEAGTVEAGNDVSGFGVFGSGNTRDLEGDQPSIDEEKGGEFYSRKYICQNRIPEKDFPLLGPFKSYAPGQPTSRLYIKNLAKTTDEEHLRNVFGIYVNWDDPDEVTKFDLKVLKEGRMKGQAFVSLPSVEAAQMARKETNGFILHDKPMVVCFAKSANTTSVR